MDRIKIIIDTDIGDDADDALAICLALKSEELEVMGITTVFRNTAARAQIAVRLLQLMGRTDIPVYAGIGHPLVAEADVETVPIQLLAGMEELEYRKDMDGVEYLRRSLAASTGGHNPGHHRPADQCGGSCFASTRRLRGKSRKS